jgi:hypothetical protein
VRVDFMHARPNAHRFKASGCPIRFQAPWDGVSSPMRRYGRRWSRRQKPLRVLEGVCRGSSVRAAQDLVIRCGNTGRNAWLRARCCSTTYARHLGRAATLERRPGERGTSYRGLVDGVRCDLQHLADTELRLQQIAYQAGLFGRRRKRVQAGRLHRRSSTAPGGGETSACRLPLYRGWPSPLLCHRHFPAVCQFVTPSSVKPRCRIA